MLAVVLLSARLQSKWSQLLCSLPLPIHFINRSGWKSSLQYTTVLNITATAIAPSMRMLFPEAYAENFLGGGLVQGHMVVICIWCALFVTSQFDVMFQTNVLAKFVDIIMHIFLHALPLFHVSLHWMQTISAPSWAIGGK